MRSTRANRFPIRDVIVAYLISILVAEYLLLFVLPFAGIILHSALVLTLVIWASTFAEESHSRALHTLSIIPVLRLLATMSPLQNLSPVTQELVLSIGLLTVALIYLNIHNMSLADIGLKRDFSLTQLSIGLTGIPMGVLMGIIAPQTLQANAILPILLIFFTVLIEAILFHGILLDSMVTNMGRFAGVMFAAIYYVVLFSSFSFEIVVILFTMNVMYGVAKLKTGNLSGIIVAQSIARITFVFLMPILLSLYF